MKVYKPENYSAAVTHGKWNGPSFNSALTTRQSGHDNFFGWCVTAGADDKAKYNVSCDARGNSLLTGAGGGNDEGKFICTGLEVFLIE